MTDALTLYMGGGIFSLLPNTPWIGRTVADNGTDKLRMLERVNPQPIEGLRLCADQDCRVEIYHCLRPIDFTADPPTWNEYAPSASGEWAAPGGIGPGDSNYLGALDLVADGPATLANPAVKAAFQVMCDGASPCLLILRCDRGQEVVGILNLKAAAECIPGDKDPAPSEGLQPSGGIEK